MISLFIDTSTVRLTVAVVFEDENKVISLYSERTDGELSTKVFSVIEDCINLANIEPNDIKKIYVSNGPGSFTGIRIGITIAKTFAWAKKLDIVTLSSLEIMASTNVNSDCIVSLIDARRGFVFGAIYDSNLNVLEKDSYVLLDELILRSKVYGSATFISDDKFIEISDVLEPNIDILKLISKHKNDKVVNPHLVNPSYLKITEAEANLIGKENND